MPKELFNQGLVDEPAGSDRIAVSVPGASGGKNILYSKFKDIMRAGSADYWVAGTINKSPAIRQVGDELFLLRESVVLPFDSQVSPALDDINWVSVGTIAHNTLAGRELAGAHPATAISIDTTTFDGNLDSSVNTVQKLAQAVDDLVAGGGGVTVHNDLTGRDEDDSHPIGAITGLENRLAGIENQQSGNQLTFASIYGYYNFI